LDKQYANEWTLSKNERSQSFLVSQIRHCISPLRKVYFSQIPASNTHWKLLEDHLREARNILMEEYRAKRIVSLHYVSNSLR
jgi:hypothetical protein